MSKNNAAKLKACFKEAAMQYRNAIMEDYRSREGDESVREAPRAKVIVLFKNSPAAMEASLLFSLVKIMANPIQGEGAERLNAWLLRLFFELTNDLEKA